MHIYVQWNSETTRVYGFLTTMNPSTQPCISGNTVKDEVKANTMQVKRTWLVGLSDCQRANRVRANGNA